MGVKIREATLDDFESIVELFRQLWPGKELNKNALLNVFNQMKSSDIYQMLCAEEGGKVIGFCSTAILHNFWQEGNILYITVMIVDEAFRNKGVGRKMVQAVLDIAQARSCKKIELESAFYREKAHAFYEKNGFVKRAYFYSKDVP